MHKVARHKARRVNFAMRKTLISPRFSIYIYMWETTKTLRKLSHNMMKKIIAAFLFIALSPFTDMMAAGNKTIYPVSLSDIYINGELRTRSLKNFDRLEESKYQPDNVFLTEKQSGGWPGDTEGRTILGLVMEAQASHREPRYLNEILRLLPAHLNKSGYMGTIYNGMLNEQELSGNGWLLRGLCEYYLWKKDKQVLPIIRSIAQNLFVAGKGLYKEYPIDPALRQSQGGGASGNISNTYHHWMLSTDIGCVFIGMDGAIQAYSILHLPELKEVIDEMINSFLSVDVVKIKAQTHATLTACRGLIRYADITGDNRYVDEVVKRWKIYKTDGMTECFGNYNWFDRYDTWTEPCAIVDSYMLAVQLWQHTGNSTYRDDAEQIYFNAIAHAQRVNGGFGCDNCPGLSSHCLNLQPVIDEASWCCTMRGGEGLGRAASYAYFTDGSSVIIPFFHSSEATIHLSANHSVSIAQTTDYPFDSKVILRITHSNARRLSLRLAAPYWTTQPLLTLNGKKSKFKKINGFIELRGSFKKGDVIAYTFKQDIHYENTLNKSNTQAGQFKVFYGPLLLAADSSENAEIHRGDKLIKTDKFSFVKAGTRIRLVPVYQLLDPAVCTQNKANYHRQVIF